MFYIIIYSICLKKCRTGCWGESLELQRFRVTPFSCCLMSTLFWRSFLMVKLCCRCRIFCLAFNFFYTTERHHSRLERSSALPETEKNAEFSPPPLAPGPLNPGQQLHLSSLTYRDLTQLETFNRYLSNLQDNVSQ